MTDSSSITFQDFLAVDIRVGTISDAQPFPEARKPAFKLWVDFGPQLGIKKTSAQITGHYNPDHLIGMQVCAVINFSPKQVGPFMSEVLVLGLSDEKGEIILVTPDKTVPNGQRLH